MCENFDLMERRFIICQILIKISFLYKCQHAGQYVVQSASDELAMLLLYQDRPTDV